MRQLSKITIFRVLLIFIIGLSLSSFSLAQDETSKPDTYSSPQDATEEEGTYSSTQDGTSEPDTYSTPQVEPSEPNPYWDENIKVKKFDENKWKSITKDLNYSEKKQPKKKKDKTSSDQTPSNKRGSNRGDDDYSDDSYNDSSSSSFDIGPIFKYIIIGLAVAIILFVLLRLLGVTNFRSNKKFDDKNTSIENIEEQLHESDLDKFLKEALNNKDYKLAIRIYYLSILKELSLRNFILWQKDKTNREYLYEMSGRDSYKSFSEVTRMFEKAWYSNNIINETDYMSVQPIFKNFAESLKESKA